MKKLLIILSVNLTLTSFIYGDYVFSDYTWITNPANGHLYALTLQHSNWCQAEAWALELSVNPQQCVHLVQINDVTENDWLAETFQDAYTQGHTGEPWQNLVWIGLQYIGGDKYSSTSWRWTSGEPATYWNYWNMPGYDGAHMYIHVNNHPYPGVWNNNTLHDYNPAFYPYGIIEFVPEPATLLLLGLGGLALRRKRKG